MEPRSKRYGMRALISLESLRRCIGKSFPSVRISPFFSPTNRIAWSALNGSLLRHPFCLGAEDISAILGTEEAPYKSYDAFNTGCGRVNASLAPALVRLGIALTTSAFLARMRRPSSATITLRADIPRPASVLKHLEYCTVRFASPGIYCCRVNDFCTTLRLSLTGWSLEIPTGHETPLLRVIAGHRTSRLQTFALLSAADAFPILGALDARHQRYAGEASGSASAAPQHGQLTSLDLVGPVRASALPPLAQAVRQASKGRQRDF